MTTETTDSVDLFNEAQATEQLANTYIDTIDALGLEFGRALAKAGMKIEAFSDLKYVIALVNDALEDLPDGCDTANRVVTICYRYLCENGYMIDNEGNVVYVGWEEYA